MASARHGKAAPVNRLGRSRSPPMVFAIALHASAMQKGEAEA
jgi:hypothetical protein